MIALAGLFAGLAVALAAAPVRVRRLGAGVGRPPRSVVIVVLGLLGLSSPRLAILAGLAVGGAVGVLLLWRRRSARVAATRTAGRLVEVCEQLAAELCVGRPPGAALDRAASSWPVLVPVAAASGIGADVPAALRVAASVPGAGDLRWVAAAWQVAQRTGQGLAASIDQVALDLREQQATHRLVDGELASARATARLVALLPVAALAMGSGVGGNPWAFLVGTPVGLGALLVGLGFLFAGLWWIEAIARGVEG